MRVETGLDVADFRERSFAQTPSRGIAPHIEAVSRFYRRRIFQPAGRSSSTERSPSPAKKEGVRLAWRAFAVNENAKDFTAQFATPVQIDPKIFSRKTYAPQSLTAPCSSNHRTPVIRPLIGACAPGPHGYQRACFSAPRQL